MYQASSQEYDYLYTILPPYFYIETNHELFESLSVPALGIPPVPPRNKFKFTDYDSDNYARCGYDSDNQCGTFLDFLFQVNRIMIMTRILRNKLWGVVGMLELVPS